MRGGGVFAALVCVMLASCGGSSTRAEEGPQGGAGGSTGGGTSGDAAMSGASGSGACPSQVPPTGQRCGCGIDDAGGPPAEGCSYPDPCSDGELVTARCESCRWRVEPDRCDFPFCGTPGAHTVCTSDQLCVVSSARAGELTYTSCVENPCGDQPASCECAGTMCISRFMCFEVSEREVSCSCPACS